MNFKQWLLEFVDSGEPSKERPDLLATALDGINPPNENPPKSPPTPTSPYVLKKRMKKKCLKD
jgi:hypothetical protein